MATPNDARPRRRFRRLRFSLRSLLIAVTILGVLLGCLGVPLNRARRQRRAIERIEALGGVVYFEHQHDGGLNYSPERESAAPGWANGTLLEEFYRVPHTVYFTTAASITDENLAVFRDLTSVKNLDLRNEPITNQGLASLKRLRRLERLVLDDTLVGDEGVAGFATCFPNLTILALSRTGVSDRALTEIGNMRRLQALSLFECEVGDEGVAHIGNLAHITSFRLGGTKITDQGVRRLAGFPRLNELLLSDTAVTDESLGYLRSARSLEYLAIENTQITDVGLEMLSEMKQLKVVYLGSNRTTKEGVNSLKAALPNCKFY